MAFLDSTPDLTGTGFFQRDLDAARAFWIAELTRLAPEWLKAPAGYFRLAWNNDAPHGVCYLIRLHQMFQILRNAVTPESWVRLDQRFQRLVRLQDEAEYKEVLTELQAAADLASRISPVAMDPMVPIGLQNSEQEPATPEFLVRFLNGCLFIEVTVLHIGYFREWDKGLAQLADNLIRMLRKRRQRRIVSLFVPFSFRINGVSKKQVREIADEIAQSDFGQLHTTACGIDFDVMWETLPHFPLIIPPAEIPRGIRYATVGIDGGPRQGIVMATSSHWTAEHSRFVGAPLGNASGPAVAVEWRPFEAELGDIILKSLRNTLKGKREQFTEHAPYLLMLRLGDFRIDGQQLKSLIETRIWPNREHAWISGVCLYEPIDLQEGKPGSTLFVIINEGADYPLPAEFIAVAEGRAVFRS